ncbi:hypothetical protein NN561_004891 [Cricetulus griseus]
MASDASHVLEAALEQMDGIIAGTKTVADISDGTCEPGLSPPSSCMNSIPVLHLIEDLRLALEMLALPQEREALLSQIPGPTAAYIKEWFEDSLSQVNHHSAASNETYQERLARLEGDKESLILQVSVLTDQVEAQGEKIRDLEVCLEGHQVKLNAAEEMLQQELLQELKHLKIKVEELENERNQYEWELKATKAEVAQLQEQVALKDAEIERLHSQLSRSAALHSDHTERGVTTRQLSHARATSFATEVIGDQDSSFLAEQKYPTLPGKLSGAMPNGEAAKSPTASPQPDPSGSSLLKLRETESGWEDTVLTNELSSTSSGTESSPQSPLTPDGKRSPKGIKKFWGKIRRTQSGNFNTDAPGMAEFRRGGLRATAGPRLSRTRDTKGQKCDADDPLAHYAKPQVPYNRSTLSLLPSDANAPFAQWSTERVCAWLEDFGLAQYVIFARQWVASGHTLLTATPQDMEKELGIKHPLHRKKLVLAVKAINAKQEEKSALLDHIWVTRWLDDIGLPQYKDQFHESRVDGRMLQYLTVSNLSPSEVVQWSNHRVMEWLRSVDLAEYAPNLRGSGVHGGLIILEPRFTGDTLAMLLNIPPQKTLLRRHLTTKFNALIGPEAEQEKRDKMASPAYSPLTTTAKVRPRKLGFSHFGNMRKKKFDESTDYICPMEPGDAANDSHRVYGVYRGQSPLDNHELDGLDQMAPSEGTVTQIGLLSQDIHRLTVGFQSPSLQHAASIHLHLQWVSEQKRSQDAKGDNDTLSPSCLK